MYLLYYVINNNIYAYSHHNANRYTYILCSSREGSFKIITDLFMKYRYIQFYQITKLFHCSIVLVFSIQMNTFGDEEVAGTW